MPPKRGRAAKAKKSEEVQEPEVTATNGTEKPGKPEKAQKEKPGKAEKAEKVDKSEKPEKVEKSDKTEKVDKSEKPEKVEKPEKPEKVEKPEKAEKVEKPKKTEKSEKSAKNDKSAKSGKSEKPEKPEEKVEVSERASRSSKRNKKETVEENGEPEAKRAKVDPKALKNQTESKLNDIDYSCDKKSGNGKNFNLKVCTWNISGLRAVIKKNGLDYIEKEDADIVALQETKCDTNKLPDEIKMKGYHHYFVDSKKAGYCGVALLTKKKPINVTYGLKDSELNNEGRMITAEFDDYYLITVYVPNAGQKLVTMPKRLQWNEEFKAYVKELDAVKPVIICGDMNVAHEEIDLTNPKTNTKNAGFTKEERDGMTDFLKAGFIDVFRSLYPERTGAYTFWAYFNNARAKNVGWRLDYYLLSEKLKKNVCDVVIRDQVFGSDHCPVILYAEF